MTHLTRHNRRRTTTAFGKVFCRVIEIADPAVQDQNVFVCAPR